VARWLSFRRRTGRGSFPITCLRERPNPESCWGKLSRGESPGEHRRGDLALAKGMGSQANGLPGGAKLRSGRAGDSPATPARARRTVVEVTRECVRAADLAVPGNRRHGSCVSVCLRADSRQRAGAAGKVIAKLSLLLRWRLSDANPQGSNGPRERVQLPGKGKLRRAAPERRERYVTRPRSVGTPR